MTNVTTLIGALLCTLGEHRVSAKASDLLGLGQAEANVLFTETAGLDCEDEAMFAATAGVRPGDTEGAALAVIDALLDRDTTGPLSDVNAAILDHYGLSTVPAGPVTTGGTA